MRIDSRNGTEVESYLYLSKIILSLEEWVLKSKGKISLSTSVRESERISSKVPIGLA